MRKEAAGCRVYQRLLTVHDVQQCEVGAVVGYGVELRRFAVVWWSELSAVFYSHFRVLGEAGISPSLAYSGWDSAQPPAGTCGQTARETGINLWSAVSLIFWDTHRGRTHVNMLGSCLINLLLFFFLSFVLLVMTLSLKYWFHCHTVTWARATQRQKHK